MAPWKARNSKQPASEPENTQSTPDNGEGPSQPQEPKSNSNKSPTPERDPKLEPEDEEKMLEKQLAKASKQAHLAALQEKIVYEHQYHIQTEVRIQN